MMRWPSSVRRMALSRTPSVSARQFIATGDPSTKIYGPSKFGKRSLASMLILFLPSLWLSQARYIVFGGFSRPAAVAAVWHFASAPSRPPKADPGHTCCVAKTICCCGASPEVPVSLVSVVPVARPVTVEASAVVFVPDEPGPVVLAAPESAPVSSGVLVEVGWYVVVLVPSAAPELLMAVAPTVPSDASLRSVLQAVAVKMTRVADDLLSMGILFLKSPRSMGTPCAGELWRGCFVCAPGVARARARQWSRRRGRRPCRS